MSHSVHTMKYTILYSCICLLVFACKPYQNVEKRLEQMTYQEFKVLQKSFPSNEGNIKYIDQGKGPVIVLLHGVPTSGWLYRKMIPLLVQEGYRVIVPDMLGYGASDSPKGYEIYDNQHHAKRLLALMQSLKIATWTHVMHDAGGLWTWDLIKQSPDKINNLVILNTILFEEGFAPPIRFRPGIAAKTAMWSYRNKMTSNALLKGLFRKGLKDNLLNNLDIEGYKTPWMEKKTNAMYYFFTQTCNTFPDYTSILENIQVPISIIWGIEDEMLRWKPQEQKVVQTLKIKKDNIHLLEEKHFIQEGKPREVTQHILDFLQQND